MPLAKKTAVPLALALLVLAAGCGTRPAEQSAQQKTLSELHEMYRHFIKSQQKAPKQMSDLAKRQYEGIYPMAVAALKQGKYVVVWGVNGTDSGTVLAYEKDAPSKGGAVLMADGTVRDMTADQLKSAKKS